MNNSERNSRAENLVLIINATYPPTIILAVAIASFFFLPTERREIILTGTLSAAATAWTVGRGRNGSDGNQGDQNISLEAELNSGEGRGSGR